MSDATVHMQYQDSTLRLIRWIADHGLPPGVSSDAVPAMVPPSFLPSLNLALLSPGQGFRTFFARVEREVPEQVEDFRSIADEKLHKKDIDGLLTDIKTLADKARRIETMEKAIEELLSGDALREMDALVSVKESVTDGLIDDTPLETVKLPGDAKSLDRMYTDRDKNPRTWTIFDGWTLLGDGELGVILGAPNVGKTTAFVELGTGYVTHNPGLVVHFSEEMNATSISAKYAACMTSTKIGKKTKKAVFRKFERELKNVKGTLVIESHATGSSTVSFLEHRVREILRDTEASHVTAVLVDYAGILRSASFKQQSRFDELSKIIIALRGMASNLGCPVWTASQPQRNPTRDMQRALSLANMELPVLGMADVAECWAIPQVADYVVSLNQTEKERQSKPPIVRVHRAKVREPVENALDDFTVAQRVDYATCTFA